MRSPFGPRQAARLSIDDAARRVLAGDLGVGEAARLTGRKKAEIALAVDHIIYRESRIGLEESVRRRRPPWWRRWPGILAATILVIEAAVALAVFHDNIRQFIVPPSPAILPRPRFAAPNPPPPAVPPLDKLLPTTGAPAAQAPSVAPSSPASAPASPAPASAPLRCPTEPGQRAALAAICRGTPGSFAAPECECLR